MRETAAWRRLRLQTDPHAYSSFKSESTGGYLGCLLSFFFFSWKMFRYWQIRWESLSRSSPDDAQSPRFWKCGWPRRASHLRLESWGFKDGAVFLQSVCPVTHFHKVPSHITTFFQKNMIQCKMVCCCFFFLHRDSLNVGKTHDWDTKRSRNYLLMRITWLVRLFLVFVFFNSNLTRRLEKLERGWRWRWRKQRGTLQQTTQTTVRLWRHVRLPCGGSGRLL